MSRREFQLIEGTTRKFWAIELDGAAYIVSFGRLGTAGQTQRRLYPARCLAASIPTTTACEARSSANRSGPPPLRSSQPRRPQG
jgi:predicted DNA-binding WGR domain protein